MQYVVFDVETPNCANDRISAIGISVVEDGAIVEQFFSLVNPQTHFDSFNTQLTGISAEMVKDKPTFDQVWAKIELLMGGGVLVAHNAPFDLCVLAKCLRDYNIYWKASVNYLDTVRLARNYYPNLPNYKLNTISNYLGIALDHHRADSDSTATALILCDILSRGAVDNYIRSYDLDKSPQPPKVGGRWIF